MRDTSSSNTDLAAKRLWRAPSCSAVRCSADPSPDRTSHPRADTTQSSWNSETYAGADDRASRRVHYPRHHHYNAQDRIQS